MELRAVLGSETATELFGRYQYSRDIAALNASVKAWREALAATSAADPRRPRVINNLVLALCHVHEWDGNPSTLDEIRHFEEQLLAEEVEIVLLAGQTTVVLNPALPAELAAEVRDDLLDGRHRNPLDEVEGIDGGVIRLVQVAEVALVER